MTNQAISVTEKGSSATNQTSSVTEKGISLGLNSNFETSRDSLDGKMYEQ